MARIKYEEAIGLEKKRGRPSIGRQPAKYDLVRLYVKEERSIREAAEILSISKDMACRALKKHGIKTRSNASRSRLRIIPLRDLRASVREKGISGTARDLGVDKSTLRHHLKTRKGQ